LSCMKNANFEGLAYDEKRMKSIGLFKALKLCKDYQKMDISDRDALRSKRYADLLTYAREHSPYYAKLYAGLPENPELSDLPPVTKPQLMANWDEWVTDRAVKLDDVNQFMSSRNNLGKKLNGIYQVYTTSGSTGNPSPWLEIEGRTDDVTSFEQNGKRIQIAPLAIYAALKEVHSLSRFQLTVKDNNECILRIVPAVGVSKEAAFAEAKEALTRFLATQKVTDFSCVLAPDAPAASKRSGKFKHIVNQQTWSCGGDVIGYYSKIDIERR
jgi:phenylacetate-coenzyme A ligase PaaK-like adenylate-forming protein